jgi:hypothetical protein
MSLIKKKEEEEEWHARELAAFLLIDVSYRKEASVISKLKWIRVYHRNIVHQKRLLNFMDIFGQCPYSLTSYSVSTFLRIKEQSFLTSTENINQESSVPNGFQQR